MVETYQEFIRRIEDKLTFQRTLEEGMTIYEIKERISQPASYQTYGQNSSPQNKRRLFLHITGYLPSNIRGVTDTLENIWINYHDYEKEFVLNHELIHVLHPDWPESLVREFHSTYIVDKSRFDLIRN